MQRVKLSLACLLCASWVTSVSAQTELEGDSGVAVMQDFSGGVSLGGGAYFNIQHLSGAGVGYTSGYTNIGAFVPYWLDEDTMIAPNGRMWFTNNNTVGGSLGGVVRRYVDTQDRIYGFNLFGDFDQTSTVRSYDYKQLGFGFESLGEFFDMRSNVYIPQTNNGNFVQAVGLGNTPIFAGNGINFLGVGQFEEALRGADVEVGTPVTPNTPWLRAYAGIYGYEATGADPVGARGRLEATISNDLTIGVNVSEDNRFGTNVNAVVDFRFSGFQPTRYFPQWTTRERMTTGVQRNGRIATTTFNRDVPIQAINPGTGLPYFVVWVDNDNPLPGNGSYENPYQDFQPSQPYPNADLILVRRGHSDVTPLNGPVQLFDNQRLLGEGREHSFAANAQFEQLVLNGTFLMPGFVNSGLYPTITAPGDIITLANNNEVSAFNLINAGGAGIADNPVTGTNRFNINYVNATGNQRGIFLQNANDIGVISNVNALDNALGGISIANTQALDLLLQDVTSNSTLPGTQAVGIELTATNAPLTVVMNNVTASNNGAGARINGLNSDIVAIFNTVNASQNAGQGLEAFIDGGSLAMAANSLNASANEQDNINLQFTNGARMDLVFSFVDASASTLGSGIRIFNSGGTGTAFLDLVNAAGNAGSGFIFQGDNAANIQALISGNSFLNNNGQNAIQVGANNLSTVSLAAENVNATGSGTDGLFFSATGNSLLNLDFTNVQLDNSGLFSGGRGILGVNFDSTVVAALNNVTANNNGGDGLFLVSVNGTNDIRINGGSFANNGQFTANSAGINVFASNSSNVLLNVVAAPLNNDFSVPATQADGLRISSNFGSTINANLDGVDMTSNLDNAVDVTVATNGVANVNLVNSDGSFSGFSGLKITAESAGQLNLVADATPFNVSGANGLDAFVRTDADVFVEFRNGSDILFSGQNGVKIDIADAGSTFVGQFNDVNVSESGIAGGGIDTQDAFHVVATDSAQVDLSLVNTTSNNFALNSQQRSLYAKLQTGAVLNFNNTNGDMSSNLMNAVSVAIANPGTTANLNIQGTPMNNSGETGFLWFLSDSGTLNATVINSTLDSSGSGGVQGSGIYGVATTGGMANLLFANTPITNALDDAVFVVATDLGTTVNATFNNSPMDNAGQSALDVAFYNGAAGIFNLVNGTTGINAGLDAVRMVADGVAGGVNTSLTVNIFDGDLSDSGQVVPSNGINVQVSNNANTQLNVINTPVTNTVGTDPQTRGLLFSVLSGGNLDATFVNSNLSNHGLEGINGVVDGFNLMDSRARIRLDSTSVDDNVLNGALFNVTNRGDLIVIAQNGTSFSDNGATGIQANVDGALSTATFILNDVAVDNNGALVGGAGMAVQANNAASFAILSNGSSFSNNANRGVDLLTTTASAGFARFNDITADNNQEEGFRAEANSGSTLYTAAIGGSISNNGAAGTFDNVRIITTGASRAEAYFDSVNADNSTLNGFNFDVNQGSILLGQIRNGSSGNDNANGSGVRFIARDALTQGVLYMEGPNTFDNNGTAVVGTAVSPQAGAGVFFDANGVDVAAIRFSGGASDNGNPPPPPANPTPNLFADVDGDGDRDDDGVYIGIRNTNRAAVELTGGGNISNNAGDGIDVNLFNVGTLGPVTQPSVFSPPSVVVGANGNAIAIDNLNVDGNAGTGISIIVDNTNMTGDISVTDSQSTNNGGDGLFLGLTNVTGQPNVTIARNGFNTNAGNGVNLSFNNSSIDALNIVDNAAGVAPGNSVGAIVAFGSFGNDQGIRNTSGAGIDITALLIDLTAPDFFYDSIDPGAAFPFDPDSPFGPFGAGIVGDTATTGLTSIDGQPVDAGVVPLANGGVPYPGGGKIDDSHTLAFTWNAFGPGEQYDWNVDMDTESQTAGGISGVDLFTPIVGDPTWTGPATVTVTFSTGDVITVPFMADPGDPNATIALIAPAAVANGGISDNGLDGIRISQVNSNIQSLNIDNNLIDGNGTAAGAGNGNGINFATVTNSTIADPAGGLNRFNVANNIITNNDGDGFRLINPQTGAQTSFDMTFDSNDISTNVGTGINLTLVSGQQNLGGVPQVPGLNADFLNNTINGNTGGPGINIALANNRNFSGNFNGNTISQNGAEGVNFAPGVNSQIVANFTNNTISSNASHGIDLPMQTGGTFTSQNFFGNTINSNGGMGVNLVVQNNGQMNWALGNPDVAANTFSGNADAGVGIVMNGNATGTLNVRNSTFSNTINGADANFDGDGLSVIQRNSSTLTGGISTSTFNNNVADGARFQVRGDNFLPVAQLNNFVVGGLYQAGGAPNNVFRNNGQNGLEFLRTSNGEINNAQILNSLFQDNAGDGIVITAANQNTDDTYNIVGNLIRRNTNGIRLQVFFDADINANITGNVIGGSFFDANPFVDSLPPHAAGDANRNDGIQTREQVNAAVDNRSILGQWSRNTIVNNGGDGIDLGAAMDGLLVGSTVDPLLGNLIQGNDANGILVTGAGDVTIGFNAILQNGTAGTLLTANETAGINVQAAPSSSVTIVDNLIAENIGDGIQHGIPNASGFFDQIFIDGNDILRNTGRGIDILNHGNNFLQAQITDNFVTENGLEGIYIVNTASNTQSQTVSSSTALLRDGSVFARPVLEAQIAGNTVVGNGQNSGLSGTGLVVRVGTSDGGFGTNFAGGFASVGGAVALGGSPFGQATGFGGVTMTVDSNDFGGNAGNDVLFHSFVSTVNPNTGTNWDTGTTPEFNTNGYQSDPLSRFDLYFRDNRTDVFSVDDVGTSLGGFNSRNPLLVAFYDNADAEFKSRDQSHAAPPAVLPADQDGPFNNAGRARNATRQAARIPFFTAPASPVGATYLYPGMGDSTWRISGDTLTDAQNLIDQNFVQGLNVDFPSPVTTTNDENGVFLIGVGNNGEMPFGWGVFP